VTIFGSARIRPATSAYDQVKHLAARLAAMQCEIVTGEGPGLMQAANEGAASVVGGVHAAEDRKPAAEPGEAATSGRSSHRIW
jgi:predicted Rossmann-fold nucleotide-binding protein